MLKIVIVAILVLLGVVLVFAATRPDTFQVKRVATIEAPPDSYGGSPAGEGATYAWEGNKDVGAGRMEIVEASAPGRVAIKLDFTRPFEAHNRVVFSMVPAGGATEVTWDMQGPANYLSKLIGVFVNMDRMVGTDFEVGLANLKAAAEK